MTRSFSFWTKKDKAAMEYLVIFHVDGQGGNQRGNDIIVVEL